MTEPPVSAITAQPRRIRRRWLLIVAIAFVVIAAGATGAFLFLRNSNGLTINGTVELVDPNLSGYNDGTCAGSGGYSDLRTGAQVVVTSASGDVIGVGKLGASKWATGSKLCTFSFSVRVPAGKGFYGVEVSHRGRLQYSEEDLTRPLRLQVGR